MPTLLASSRPLPYPTRSLQLLDLLSTREFSDTTGSRKAISHHPTDHGAHYRASHEIRKLVDAHRNADADVESVGDRNVPEPFLFRT